MEKENKVNIFESLSVKDWIAIIIFVVSIVGVFYRLETKTEVMNLKVEKVEQKLDEFKPDAVKVELDYVRKDLDKLDVKLDRILDKLEK